MTFRIFISTKQIAPPPEARRLEGELRESIIKGIKWRSDRKELMKDCHLNGVPVKAKDLKNLAAKINQGAKRNDLVEIIKLLKEEGKFSK